MKNFLAAVLLFGFLVSLFQQLLLGLRPFNAVTIFGALGGGVPYLLIATLILRPWRERRPPDRPPYLAAAVTVGIMACFFLVGSA